jgi:hypothetical protein
LKREIEKNGPENKRKRKKAKEKRTSVFKSPPVTLPTMPYRIQSALVNAECSIENIAAAWERGGGQERELAIHCHSNKYFVHTHLNIQTCLLKYLSSCSTSNSFTYLHTPTLQAEKVN